MFHCRNCGEQLVSLHIYPNRCSSCDSTGWQNLQRDKSTICNYQEAAIIPISSNGTQKGMCSLFSLSVPVLRCYNCWEDIRYHEWIYDWTKAEQPEWFFEVNMIAPTSNPVRMQFSQLMEKEVQKIGIGSEMDLISWAALGPRATDQEVGPYAEGGYDICFIGMSLGTPAGHPGARSAGY